MAHTQDLLIHSKLHYTVVIIAQNLWENVSCNPALNPGWKWGIGLGLGKPLTRGEIGGESWVSLVAFHTIWRWVSESATGDGSPIQSIVEVNTQNINTWVSQCMQLHITIISRDKVAPWRCKPNKCVSQYLVQEDVCKSWESMVEIPSYQKLYQNWEEANALEEVRIQG